MLARPLCRHVWFIWFGRFLDATLKLVLAFGIVEYFTGFFTWALGSWGFGPIIADEVDRFRALEIAGYIGIMLASAFPMAWAARADAAAAHATVPQRRRPSDRHEGTPSL